MEVVLGSPVVSGLAFSLGPQREPRSLLWQARTKDDELHLATQAANGPIRLTAYPTGRWRIEIGSVISRWHRPKEFRPGWTRGPDVVLPGTGPVVTTAAVSPKIPAIIWLAPPDAGRVARVQIWFANPHAEEQRWWSALPRSTQRVGVLALRRAGAVHFVRDDEAADSPVEEPAASSGREVIVRADQAGRPSLWETIG